MTRVGDQLPDSERLVGPALGSGATAGQCSLVVQGERTETPQSLGSQ